jgi:hypothetical protein
VWLCFICHGRAHELRRRLNSSAITKAALAARKAQGVRLGNPTNLHIAARMGAAANRKLAEDFARNVMPVVEQLRRAGTTTLQGIARALNERGVRTAHGGAWYATSVRNLLARA